MIREIGSVQIDGPTVKFLIAYRWDQAILEFSIAGSDGRERYVPLFASTDRSIKEVTLSVVVSKSNDRLWVQSSWPGEDSILAYYQMGTDTALTPFGPKSLFDTPFPEDFGGGPLPFPPFEPDVRILGTFRHAGN
jgi:hypothetical protein